MLICRPLKRLQDSRFTQTKGPLHLETANTRLVLKSRGKLRSELLVLRHGRSEVGCVPQATGYGREVHNEIVETLRYVTPMGHDVLTYLILDQLASPHRKKLNDV